MQNKLIEQAKKCKSVDEIIALAKEKGVTITEAEAKNCFAMLNKQNGELADNELDSVSGGTCYTDDGYAHVTFLNSCPLFDGYCNDCEHYHDIGLFAGYCDIRTRDNDPYKD